MDKQTLSNYGWLVIVTLILAVMLAIATPFGNFVGDGVVSVANGLVGTSNNATDKDNIDTLGSKWGNKLDPLNPSGIIPTNAVYYVGVTGTTVGDYSGATATYTEGERFPKPQNGDVYVYGDYEYRYNMRIMVNDEIGDITWGTQTNFNGWGVRVLDKTKTDYEDILQTVNSKPIVMLVATFKGCRNLTKSPKLPDSTIWAQHCFYYCFSLEVAPKLPKSSEKINYMFAGCCNLTTAPKIEGNINDMNYMFINCSNLQGVVEINCTPYYCDDVFALIDMTGKNITLTGTSTNLQQIAETSTAGTRIVYDINGNILKQ